MAHLAIDGVEPLISTDTGPRHAVVPFGEPRPDDTTLSQDRSSGLAQIARYGR
jgi:hypothetical protein